MTARARTPSEARRLLRDRDRAERAADAAEEAMSAAVAELRDDEPCPYCGRVGKQPSIPYRVIVEVKRRSGKTEPIVSEPYPSKAAAESEMNSLRAVGYKAIIQRVS